MQHHRVRPDIRRELDVPRHLQHRHLARLLVEARELVELGIALRGGKRNGTEGVDATDWNLVEPRLEPFHLAQSRVESKLQFAEAELQRLKDYLNIIRLFIFINFFSI